MLSGIAEWTTDVIEKGSYWGLCALVALENVFPPIPSEIVLPMAGFLTGQGRLNYIGAVVAATIGSVVGAYVLYELGKRLGERRVLEFFQKHGKWLLVSECDYDKAADWFRRHGPTAVFVGRCVPGVRSFVSIPAGIQRMPLGRFFLYTIAGSGIYNCVLIGLGWLLGNSWDKVSKYTSGLEAALWVLLGCFLGYWIVRKKRQRKLSGGSDPC